MSRIGSWASGPIEARVARIEALLGLSRIDDEVFEQPQGLTVHQIALAAAKVFDVDYREMVSKRRSRQIFYARAAVCWIARHATMKTLPQIARAFDGCDHSSVMHRVASADRLMTRNGPYRAAVLKAFELAQKETLS